jgi:hypothetical protein
LFHPRGPRRINFFPAVTKHKFVPTRNFSRDTSFSRLDQSRTLPSFPKFLGNASLRKIGFAAIPHQSLDVTKGVSWMDGHSVPPAWCSPHATGHLGRVDESTPSFPRRTTLKSRRGSGGMGGAVGSCGPRVVGVQKRGCRVVSDDAGDSECCRKVARRLHEGCRPWCSGAVPIEASDRHRFATAGGAGGGKGAGWGERLQFGSTHPATIA